MAAEPAGREIIQPILDLWKACLPHKPQPKKVEGARFTSLKARWGEHPDLNWWYEVFQAMAHAKPFMRDSKSTGFDWCLQPANITKLLEGNYAPDTTTNGRASPKVEPKGYAAIRAVMAKSQTLEIPHGDE